MSYVVCVERGECFRPQRSLKKAKAFARIGSQRGRPRVVVSCPRGRRGPKGCRKVRRYARGKRTWPK